MKLGQFVECNINIVLKKLYTACGEEASPKTFHLKIKTKHISGLTAWTVISRGLPNYIKTKVLDTCFYLIYKAFLRN